MLCSDFDDRPSSGRNQLIHIPIKFCVSFRFWVGYQYVITNQSHTLQGRWEVAYKGSDFSKSPFIFFIAQMFKFFLMFLIGSVQVFLPPEGLAKIGETSSQDNVFCAQLQRFQLKNMNDQGLHSWHAENCYKKFPFLCKRSMCWFCAQLVTEAPAESRFDCFILFHTHRTNLRGHQRQRGERGLLLHPERKRPVPELHVSRRRAGDVRGGAVRAAAGLPALPQRSQRVLQVHLPGSRCC